MEASGRTHSAQHICVCTCTCANLHRDIVLVHMQKIATQHIPPGGRVAFESERSSRTRTSLSKPLVAIIDRADGEPGTLGNVTSWPHHENRLCVHP